MKYFYLFCRPLRHFLASSKMPPPLIEGEAMIYSKLIPLLQNACRPYSACSASSTVSGTGVGVTSGAGVGVSSGVGVGANRLRVKEICTVWFAVMSSNTKVSIFSFRVRENVPFPKIASGHLHGHLALMVMPAQEIKP